MCYIKANWRCGILVQGHPADVIHLVCRLRVDANHANDTDSAKSTSGGSTNVEGVLSFLPYTWMASRQTVTGISTGDVETVALRDNLYQDALPVVGILEQFVQRPMRIIGKTNSSACQGAVKRGFSRKLP